MITDQYLTISEKLRRLTWIQLHVILARTSIAVLPLDKNNVQHVMFSKTVVIAVVIKHCSFFCSDYLTWPQYSYGHLSWPKYFWPFAMTWIFQWSSDLFFHDMYCGQVPTDTPAVMYLTTLLVSLLSRDHLKLIVNKENNDSVWAKLVVLHKGCVVPHFYDKFYI